MILSAVKTIAAVIAVGRLPVEISIIKLYILQS